ncbi:pyridoxal phosphate-dependent decarboxylase family protein [Thermostaphylospora chromogena]|uniref:L-2,4-diaminobutyrate decarboxylase n=1 Tax=Thermostaphylospora chromogena TaxID=35622 RepID=A0A1H1E8W9_9ACTN|nr:pyridoxal-dependent decarboxylase [Thermostaphylospora chromogena]SDQ85104.1 L-2,4-diaminobutyrate decarboxylase [Thermostaphylospora chromogena]
MWDIEEFERAAHTTVAALAAYVDESQHGLPPVTAQRPPAELARRLGIRRWIREGGMTDEDYRRFLDVYLAEGTRLHHPSYLGHQSAAPDFPAALADFVHGATNNPMAIYEMGASAATVELEILRWMLDKVGFGSAGGGVLTHGGSLANLTAMLAARARAVPEAWTDGVPGDLALLAPPSAHYSVTRAAAILGLGERAIIPLPVDRLGRIEVARLPEALEHARRAGRRPFVLVASACSTGTGLYDDLRPIGEFCAEHGIWFHVDGAHGASALLSDAHRHLLDGIETADSVIWDAHKMMRVSSLATAVLVRREADLDRAFQQEASYLFYGERSFDLIGRTVECTKAQLGLKIFLNLAWRGERGMGEYVAARYATAHRLWELARERPGFTCPYEPQSNIVCFRYGSREVDQAALRKRLMDDGTFYLTSTEVDGVRHLRATVIAPATDDKAIEALLDAIAEVGTRIAA